MSKFEKQLKEIQELLARLEAVAKELQKHLERGKKSEPKRNQAANP